MRYYNFTAVFPPQDAMVGDIYLVFAMPKEQLAKLSPGGASKRARKSEKREYSRLTRLDVRTLLKSDWQKRINLPSTSQGASAKPVDIFKTQTNFTTLPTAAFIGYNIVNITEGDAGVAFPIHLFRTFLGTAFENQLALSISAPSLSSSSCPGSMRFVSSINFAPPRAQRNIAIRPTLTQLRYGSGTNDPLTFIVKQFETQSGYIVRTLYIRVDICN